MKRFSAMCVLLGAALLSASVSAEAPSAARLLDQARRKLAAINDYSVDIRLDVTGGNITIKGMTMTLYFKKPGKTRIVARQGFAAMPRSMTLGDVVTELTRNCKSKMIKTQKKNGIDCYVIRLDPIRQGGQPPVLLWLDKSRLLVRATQVKAPFPVKTEWQYGKVDEKYDLPRRIDAEIVSPQAAGFHHRDPDEPRRANPGRKGPGPGGTQTIHATLSFSNYKVNKGIRDSVFASGEQSPRPRGPR